MSRDLKVLADNQDALLLAEIGAWLHNLGKYSEEFLYSQFASAGNSAYKDYASFKYQHIVGIVADIYTAPSSALSPAAEQRLRDMLGTWDVDKTLGFLLDEHPDFVRWLRRTTFRLPSPLDERDYAVGEIIEFQDYKWYSGSTPLITDLFPEGSKATELLEFSHNAGSGVEKGGAGRDGSQTDLPVYRSTAFGYELELPVTEWQNGRERLLAAVLQNSITERNALRPLLQKALGDTRRPINEVTLWDLSASVAAFYKAALAKVILDQQWTKRNDFRWRAMRLFIDGLSFFGDVARLPDILARKAIIEDAFSEVRNLLENEIPLGMEVYRDENGSIFLMPDLQNDDDEGTTLKQLTEPNIYKAFVAGLAKRTQPKIPSPAIEGEVLPVIKVSTPHLTALSIVELFQSSASLTLIADSQQVASWWHNRKEDVCPVCGIRPIGPSQKAIQRKVCTVCEERRGDRAKEWSKNLNTTIWTDEVADTTGRLSLLLGAFELAQWLDGTLLSTLTVREPNDQSGHTAELVSKNPSFARIRRVWETTRTFWQEITQQLQTDEALIPLKGYRLSITPQNPAALDLGPYHAYELVVNGIRVSVIWDQPNEHFITADNLDYLASSEQLGKPLMQAVQKGSQYRLEEPSGYGGANRKLGSVTVAKVKTVDAAYAPVIPILAEPRTFMALVSADKAIAVVQAIKAKYEREMGKVRNRLPLHLGVVYAGRRTPLASVLDAGRRMLRQQGDPAGWRVKAVRTQPDEGGILPERFQEDIQGQFAKWYEIDLEKDGRQLTWYVPAVMGDGQTEDCWYPYVFWVRDRDNKSAPSEATKKRTRYFQAPNPFNSDSNGSAQLGWLVHAGELQKDDLVYFTPSTFDFEYLDVSARRFEVAYGDNGRRLGQDKQQRPYLLEEVDAIEKSWEIISKALSTSQIKALEAIIESKRQAWEEPTGTVAGVSDAFRQFVADTLANAGAPADLLHAALSGMLTDALEIHMTLHKEKTAKDTSQKETSHAQS